MYPLETIDEVKRALALACRRRCPHCIVQWPLATTQNMSKSQPVILLLSKLALRDVSDKWKLSRSVQWYYLGRYCQQIHKINQTPRGLVVARFNTDRARVFGKEFCSKYSIRDSIPYQLSTGGSPKFK